jgi:hypothetical protein
VEAVRVERSGGSGSLECGVKRLGQRTDTAVRKEERNNALVDEALHTLALYV